MEMIFTGWGKRTQVKSCADPVLSAISRYIQKPYSSSRKNYLLQFWLSKLTGNRDFHGGSSFLGCFIWMTFVRISFYLSTETPLVQRLNPMPFLRMAPGIHYITSLLYSITSHNINMRKPKQSIRTSWNVTGKQTNKKPQHITTFTFPYQERIYMHMLYVHMLTLTWFSLEKNFL